LCRRSTHRWTYRGLGNYRQFEALTVALLCITLLSR